MASPNIRSQADSESMGADVPASDETEPGRCLPAHVYPKEIRARAIELFKKGCGLQAHHLRAWHQAFRCPRLGAALAQGALYGGNSLQFLSLRRRNH